MRFLVDAQLPPALVGMLRAHGHTAEHVIEVGSPDMPDRELWEYALAHNAVILTKDEDFTDMVFLAREAPPVVWIRVGNTRRQELFSWLEPLLDRIVEEVESGNRLIELR